MISLTDLKKLAVRMGVPQGVVEKDVALSVALKAVSLSGLAKHAVFKGGTAIKKVYFDEARFSEDLDFTVINLDKHECLRLLKGALEGRIIEGIAFEKMEEEKTTAGLRVAVKYTGPLAHAQRVRFDFNFRENLVGKPIYRKLIDPYNIGFTELLVLDIEEIFAEKIHALGSRSAPRDLYDMWFLSGKSVKVDKHTINKKFAYYNEKFDAEKAIENARESKGYWTRDLGRLLRDLPGFERVEREVEKKLLEIS